MAKATVKLAQPGIDAKTAGDENLIFSSDWPLLKIFKQGQFVASKAGDLYTVVEHNLGYPPVFFYFGNNAAQNWLTRGTTGALDSTMLERSEFAGALQRVPVVDPKIMYYNARGSFEPPDSFYYYLYALPLDKAYTAPKINVGKQPKGQSPRSVFKVAKPGKSIKSKNLEDYAIHSATRSPLIHSVTPQTTAAGDYVNGFGITVYHELGYVPMYVTYQKIDGTNQWLSTAPLLIGGGADAHKITLEASSAGIETSTIILKDPFEVDFSVAVSV